MMRRCHLYTQRSLFSILTGLHSKVADMVSEGKFHQALQLSYNYNYKQCHLHFHISSSSSSSPQAQTSATLLFLLPSLIRAAGSSSSASFYHQRFGLQLHSIVLKTGCNSDPVVSNALISMYGKFSLPASSRHVFDAMPLRDSVSWNSLLNCYILNGCFANAFDMLKQMYFCGFFPKSELMASFISVCARFRHLRQGRVLHALVIVDNRIEWSVFLSTSLLDLYFKCREPSTALSVFEQMEVKNEVSWTAMVSGFTANLHHTLAIDCIRTMQVQGFKPNRVTLMAILPACTELGCVDLGKEIHAYAFRHGFCLDHRFSASLVHMYSSKTVGALRSAKLIFDRSDVKDVVMWSSIIRGCSQCGDGVQALKLFRQMLIEGIRPNSVTLLAVISACISLTSFSHGCVVHGYVLKCGLIFYVLIGNALINMYSKCGYLAESHQIFKEMHVRDLVSWSTLINSYALHGRGKEALSVFHEMQMQEKGTEPDAITFLSVLSACKYAGIVKEGQEIFDNARKDIKFPLTTEHYACQIDLLGKSGKIEDALHIVRTMPMKPSTKILSSLVSACVTHGRVGIAEMLAKQLIEWEPENAANYTLLSIVRAESGNWPGVEEVRGVMRMQRLSKCYGFSQISMGN